MNADEAITIGALFWFSCISLIFSVVCNENNAHDAITPNHRLVRIPMRENAGRICERLARGASAVATMVSERR